MTADDKELLELAAKAINGKIEWYCRGANNPKGIPNVPILNGCDEWNPLNDDGQSLRLAVKLGFGISIPLTNKRTDVVCFMDSSIRAVEAHGDPCTATRRAIVKAAAEIGRLM